MTKREQQLILREQKREMREAARLRNLESRWILLAENGYYLYTACSNCSTLAYCRGRSREAVKCENCFMGQNK